MFNKIQTKMNVYKNKQNYKRNTKKEQEFLSKLQQKGIRINVSDKKETEADCPDGIKSWSATIEMTHNNSTFKVLYQYQYTYPTPSHDIYTPDSAIPERKTMQASVINNDEAIYHSQIIPNCEMRADGVDAIQESERNRKFSDKEEQLSLLVRIAAPYAKKIFEPIDMQKRKEQLRKEQESAEREQKRANNENAKKMAIKKKLENFFDI